MAWLGIDDFKKIYVTDSATELAAEQVTECLDSAESQIIKKITSDAKSEVEADSPTNLILVKDIRRAQGKLAYAELLLIESSRYRSGGIVSTERDENNSVTNSYEKYSEIEKRIEKLTAQANELLEPYLTPSAEEEVVDKRNYSVSVPIEVCW